MMIADALASLRLAWRPTRTDFTDGAPMPATQSTPMPMFERLSDWLPYSGWLPEERLFLLERPPEARAGSHDPVEAVGFVLAITPQTGADDRMTGVLKSIFNGLPTESSLQFHLFGSPDIHDFLNRYQALRNAGGVDSHGVHVESARRRAAHLARAAVSPAFPGMPWLARDIRAALSVTLPANGMADRDAIDNARTLRDALATALKSAYPPLQSRSG